MIGWAIEKFVVPTPTPLVFQSIQQCPLFFFCFHCLSAFCPPPFNSDLIHPHHLSSLSHFSRLKSCSLPFFFSIFFFFFIPPLPSLPSPTSSSCPLLLLPPLPRRHPLSSRPGSVSRSSPSTPSSVLLAVVPVSHSLLFLFHSLPSLSFLTLISLSNTTGLKAFLLHSGTTTPATTTRKERDIRSKGLEEQVCALPTNAVHCHTLPVASIRHTDSKKKKSQATTLVPEFSIPLRKSNGQHNTTNKQQ